MLALLLQFMLYAFGILAIVLTGYILYNVIKNRHFSSSDALAALGVLVSIVIALYTTTLDPTIPPTTFIDQTNPAYINNLIRDIDQTTTDSERDAVSLLNEVDGTGTNKNGIHGPIGNTIPPRCYGVAWNIEIAGKRYIDHVITISEPVEIQMLNNEGFDGWYVTVCQKREPYLSPEGVAQLQGAIMDKERTLPDRKRWTTSALQP